ncbi:PREDICTED: F-box/kelch-repeat protein At1g15670-like [Camelina sativa]|uniref:F-box/kelch-repeat protein At1g15670-like n=1 Tax=Camelina sativa TaxID=90675 RepID=A0ABM0VP56_CAMSA|nr:PREDICTED: F-box/kelch-repeat protein At1g15670-like [Camelina sativa]
MELIPDLPETVARECLLRSSYHQFPLMASVCKLWQREISLPDFFRHRKASGHSQELVVLSQAQVDDPVNKLGSGKTIPTPVYRISVLELGSGLRSELPPVPGQSNGLPLFCRLASVGSDLVVIGGLDPVTWRTSDSVFVFNFLTSTWRIGTSMPGGPRSFFACASDSERNVFVAGGYDEDKNAMMSALVYDVAEDKWAFLPYMGRERDECTAIFHADKFHVIGGYATEEQGQFSRTAESFDVSTWRWGSQADEFLSSGMTTWPPVCAAGENGGLYACCRRDLMVMRSDTWHKVGEIPADVCNVSYMAVRRSGKLVVIGSARYGEPSVGYSWDMSNFRWVKLETHEKYEGHVQAGCFLEM